MNASQPRGSWIRLPLQRSSAQVRLFCFPYAGGGASIFAGWSAELPPEIAVCPVQLPGREDRHGEAAFRRVGRLVESLAMQITPYLDRPFAFYGHSMGAVIAFELAQCLRQRLQPTPRALFLAAHRAPHLALSRKTWHDLPDDELIEVVDSMGRGAAANLRDPLLAEYALPLLRADFEICDTYRPFEGEPLDCDLVVYGGTADTHVSHEELSAWARHTRGPFAVEMMPGNHFFLQSCRGMMMRSLVARLSRVLDRRTDRHGASSAGNRFLGNC